MLTWNLSESLCYWEWCCWVYFAVSLVVDVSDVVMRSFCLFTSNGADCLPNCPLLHSNDLDSLKCLFLKEGHCYK